MESALAWLLALFAALSTFGLAGVLFGSDSRDSLGDDHLR